ncbi:MAG: trypsin-like peptidase domain-containing protein [Dehalococcoidia bacterium]
MDLPSRPSGDGRVIETQHFGTGIVVTSDGLVLTNQHVVEGASRIRIVLPTGEERDAVPVADDAPFQDVALIRTDGRGLRTARLGESSRAAPGDPVAVIASGIVSFENQAKVGIISSRDLPFPRDGIILEGMLQTDAAVNNGDSGGALINADGEVIGLVTSVVRSNANAQPVQGVAMAHAIDDLRPFIDAVIATGAGPRGRIGIERVGRHHVPLTPETAAEQGVPLTAGALIIDVAEGSPAEDVGIVTGDVVVQVDGADITSNSPFPNLLGAVPDGAQTRLTVWRDGAFYEVAVQPRPIGAAEVPPG